MIFKGKAYRNCPWVSDGTIDDTTCKDCGSILIPKNKYGYTRTRPGLFNEKSLRVALEACKLDKASDNLDYIQWVKILWKIYHVSNDLGNPDSKKVNTEN